MNEQEIINKVINKFIEFVKENDIEIIEKDINKDTRLIGTSSQIDSMDLVSFIVEMEQVIEDLTSKEIQLASEKAMSRRTSPFISLESLSIFIKELLNE
tara:strand:- start:19241 stop:19537 length:297 start_codon:yes stop_codon:yes gene_type:complete